MSANDSSEKKKSKKPSYHGSRTIQLLEADGWDVQDQTERIVRQGAMVVRQDLFGFGDRIALRLKPRAEAMLIQETASGATARLNKITGYLTPKDDGEKSHFEWVERCAKLWIQVGSILTVQHSEALGIGYYRSKNRIQVWSWRKFKPVRGGKLELWKCVRYEVVYTELGLSYFEVDQVLPDGRPLSAKKR